MSISVGEIIKADDIRSIVQCLYYMISTHPSIVQTGDNISSYSLDIATNDEGCRYITSNTDDSLNFEYTIGVSGNIGAYNTVVKSNDFTLPSNILESKNIINPTLGDKNNTSSLIYGLNYRLSEIKSKVITPKQMYDILVYATAFFMRIALARVEDKYITSDRPGNVYVYRLRTTLRLAAIKNNLLADPPPSYVAADNYVNVSSKGFYHDSFSVVQSDSEKNISGEIPLNSISKYNIPSLILLFFEKWRSNAKRINITHYICHYVCHSNWSSGRSRR